MQSPKCNQGEGETILTIKVQGISVWIQEVLDFDVVAEDGLGQDGSQKLLQALLPLRDELTI